MADGDWIEGEKPGDGRIRHLGDGLYEFRLERLIPRPVEKVWAALTIPERLADWLGPVADLDLRLGGRFMVWFPNDGADPHASPFDADNAVRGVITEYDPPHVLAFDWNETACDERHRFELSAEPGGCRLVFTTVSLRQTTPGMRALCVAGSSAGWRLMIDDLVRSLGGEPPDDEPFEAVEMRYLAHFGRSIPGSGTPPALRGHESEPFVTPAGQGFSHLRFSRLYALPAENIWMALTEPERIARWYGAATVDLRRDGGVAFQTARGVDSGFIVALQPGRRIAWALPRPNGRHTIVSWTLAPWTWATLTPPVTFARVTLTLNFAPDDEVAGDSAAWMPRLHDLADAAKA
jgi:uncharacterized protein YndB with AHSA1/START domain